MSMKQTFNGHTVEFKKDVDKAYNEETIAS